MTREFERKTFVSDNGVRSRWDAGEVAFGALLGIPTSATAYILGQAGFDWIVLEQQHVYVSEPDLLPLMHALEVGGTTPIVRVGEQDPIGIARALDLGARGIIAPMVNSADDAELVRRAAQFPPLGDRSWGAPRMHRTPEAANADVVVTVMAETPLAVKNLEEILAVSGIDGVVLGPSDMAMNLGLPPQAGANAPEVWEMFEYIARACRDAGKHFGAMVTDAAVAARMVETGADFLLFSSDIGHVANGVSGDVTIIEELRSRADAGP